MFQLAKILYSGSNQPEPLRITGTSGESYTRGQPMKLVDGILTKVPAGEMPTHMTMETKTVQKEGDTVLCYAITPNMIFDVVCYEDIIGEFSGRKINLYGSSTNWIGVGAKAGSVATVYDAKRAKISGDHIQIRFI